MGRTTRRVFVCFWEPLEDRRLLSGVLPVNFTAADIGTPGTAGDTTFNADAWSVSGGGSVAGASDSYHFTYTTLTGNGSIVARVAAQQITGGACRAGVMMRDSLAADSRNAMCALTGSGTAEFTFRNTLGGATQSGGTVSAAAPQWVRLVRIPDAFSAYVSSDGVSWSLISTQAFFMGTTIYVGLAVCSGTSGASAVSFDHVSVPTNISRTGGSGNDSFTVRLDAGGMNFQLWQNKNPAVDVPDVLVYRGNVAACSINGGMLGSDSLTVDGSNGNPLLVPISFDGGLGSGDFVTLMGAAGDDTLTVTQNQFVFNGLVVNSPDANNIHFSAGAGNDTMSLIGALSFFPGFVGGAGNNRVDVNAGTYRLGEDAALASGNLTVTVSNATMNFQATQHLAALEVKAGGRANLTAAAMYLHTRALSIASTGRLDLNDGDLIVEYNGTSPFATVWDDVLRGYSATIDPNGGGIVSTTQQEQGAPKILGLFDNALVGAAEWPSGNAIPANAVVGHLTYFGDMNLDNQVTGDDYTVIDANLNTDPPAGLEWLSGDANLDGLVTGDDYTVIDANLGVGTGMRAGRVGRPFLSLQDDEPDELLASL